MLLTVKYIKILHSYSFQEHGDVSPLALSKRKELVKTMYYSPAVDPVDKMFTVVNALADFTRAANLPYKVIQKMHFALIILQTKRVFNRAIAEWTRHI